MYLQRSFLAQSCLLMRWQVWVVQPTSAKDLEFWGRNDGVGGGDSVEHEGQGSHCAHTRSVVMSMMTGRVCDEVPTERSKMKRL